jgi:RHS repeat-associated protein
MKKICLSLLLSFLCSQTIFAQMIWHPNLGSAPSDNIVLAWNETAYTITTENGDEFTSGDAGESINRQLLDLGIRWIRVQYIDNAETGTYLVTLQLDTNTTSSERSVAFGTYDSYTYITQKSQFTNADPQLPSDRRFTICPGCPVSFAINSTINMDYDVSRIENDGSREVVTTFRGNNGTYMFSEVLPAGNYVIYTAEDKPFTVEYYDAFNFKYSFAPITLELSANGEVSDLFFDSYINTNGTKVQINSARDLSFLDEVFEILNAEESPYWDAHIRLSYGYDQTSKRGYIRFTCGPNLSDKPINGNFYFMNASGQRLQVIQNPNGAVLSLPVTYRFDKSASRLEARIDNSQQGVGYRLYKNGDIQSTFKYGNGESITLDFPAVAGYYHIVASYYFSYGYEASIDLNGALVNDDMFVLDRDRNWIISKTYNGQKEAVNDIVYYDGLGYPSQVVQIEAAENGNVDLVRPIMYDALSRETNKYLPYARQGNSARYVDDAFNEQNAFYADKFDVYGDNAYAYTVEEYDATPLDRILKLQRQGSIYRSEDRAVRNTYFGNEANSVLRLDVDKTGDRLIANGYYAENTLTGLQTVNEDGAVVITYTDKTGRLIYQDAQLNDSPDGHVITRYVYDDYDRLAWIVTPKGSDLLNASSNYRLSDDFTKQNCYVFLYDGFGRIVEKHIAGREPEYLVYDMGDRLVMSQDGNMRTSNQWMTYEYDGLGRLFRQYLATDSSTDDQKERHEEFQANFIEGNLPLLYVEAQTLIRQYDYDDYDMLQDSDLAFRNISDMTDEGTVSMLNRNVKGWLTAEKLAVLDHYSCAETYYHRAYYYDDKGRVIQLVQKSADGGILRVTNKYDFTGNLIAQRESHESGDTTNNLYRYFVFDSRGRLTKETAQFNDGEQAVVAYTYDDLGQLTGKTYGTGAHAIHETMDYNIQGWLTRKNSELFHMELRYFDAYREVLKPSYTGNIVNWQWSHKQINGNTYGDDCEYGFHYDDLSRLTDAELFICDPIDANNEYTENGITYDKNGNIITLNRSSLSSEDTRSYRFSYNGNQRVKETNSNSLYGYDANGNISSDALSGLEISYNVLNLPSKMYGWGDYSDYYRYLADGTKILHEYSDGQQDEYRGSLVYYSNGEFSVPFGGGRLVSEGNTTEAHYFLTDHLGSTRVVAKVTPTGRIDLDRKDYYPFGKEWTQSGMPTSSNRYMFSGKERQDIESDDCVTTPLYDFGARFYDPDSGMWLQQDPILQFPSLYTYCADNPINFIDPFGLDVWTTSDPVLITRFIDEYTRTGNATMSGWRYFTDEQFFNQNGETTPYARKDNRGNYFFTYNTIENDVVVVNTMKLSRLSPFTSFNGDLDNLAWWGEQFNNSVAWTSIMALQLKHYSGITRIGSNGKLYFRTANGGVFKGNQRVVTKSLAKIGGQATQVLGTVGWMLRFMDIKNDLQNGEPYKAGARLGYGVATDASVRIPYVGPAVAGGMILIEAKWGEQMYDYVQETFE